jgi:phage host-nuclease inhibitor protein Gam
MKPRRVKTLDMNGVTTLDQLQSHISKIGQLQNKVEHLTSEVNLKIDRLTAALDSNVKAANDEIKILSKACQVFFTANAAEFVPAGKKSVMFKAGEIGTRTTPMAVTIKNAQLVIEELENRFLKECIKVAKTIDKNKLKANKDKVEDIPGITFSQKEEFFIAPVHVPIDHLEVIEALEA